MDDEFANHTDQKTAKRALWASMAFYALIAFEFFYMASPFAAYFYTVYGPGLDFLQDYKITNWTIQFFLPHLVEASKSNIIGLFEITGIMLFFGGILAFAIGVGQIYSAKLRRKDAVVQGLYRHIRHPQYLALIIASVGMLFVWPRFLVLFCTVTVIFVYIALAKTEEVICARKYPGYADYMKNTGMLLPKGWVPNLPVTPSTTKVTRVLRWGLAFVATLVVFTTAALGLRSYAISNFYTLEADNQVYLSTVTLSDADMAKVSQIAFNSIQAAPARDAIAQGQHLLNYVLPLQMYVSEIPMYLPAGQVFGHSVPHDRDKNKYKVIFTTAVFGGEGLPDGGSILWHAVNKSPIIEVWVDMAKSAVIAAHPAPTVPFYGNRQVPLF